MKQESFEWQKQSQFYKITLSHMENGFSLKIDDTKTHESWEISQKAGKQISHEQLHQFLSQSLKTLTNIDMMSAFELESLKIKRGGQPSAQNKKSNKKYLILTVGNEQKIHYPLPLQFKETVAMDEMKEMIRALKYELDSAKEEEKTNSSQSLKQQNERMKQAIKELEEQQSQKKGAVEYDQIIRQKNDLEIKAETVKREEAKEIAKLKTVWQMKEKELTDMRNEINLIRKELDIGEQGNTKLKSHIMRVVKINETELNNSKKIIAKQQKEITNHNKNILTAKQNEKKLLMKVKQIQTEIDQAKKKLNTKQISNRLYSPSGSKKSTSSAPNKPVANRVVVGNMVNRTSNRSADNSSNASSTKPRSYNGPIKSNLIKPVYKPPERDRRISDPLTRTTPALKTVSSRRDQVTLATTKFSPNRTTKPPIPSYVPPPPRNSSPNQRSASLNRLSQPRVPIQTKPPVNVKVNTTNNKPQPFRKPIASQPKVPVTKQLTQKQKNIFSKIDEIKSKLENSRKI